MMIDVKKAGAVTFVFAALCLSLARAEINYAAFLQGPDGVRVTLTDGPEGPASGWLKLGQVFAGYTIVASDAQRVVLEKDGRRIERPLREAKIKDGRMIVRGTVSAGRWGTVPKIAVSLFVGEETVFPLHENLTLRLRVERREDGTLLYRAQFVERRDGGEHLLSAPSVVARPGQPFALRFGDYGFQFSPER
jgi:hypothetical protein